MHLTHRGFRRDRRAISSVVGTILVLGVLLAGTTALIGLQITYQAFIVQRDRFEEERKAENFIIDDSSISNSSLRVTNRGTLQIRIVSIFVNHVCRWSERAIRGCTQRAGILVDPAASQWVSAGSGGLKSNDRVTVSTDRGNQAIAIFPVVSGFKFDVTNFLYFGTGPLSIIFANDSFRYSWWNTALNQSQTKNAWSGVPLDGAYINPLFSVALVNHANGTITILSESVLFTTPTSSTANVRDFYHIVDNRSTVTSDTTYSGLVAYDELNRPYIIPDNATDPATGGPPIFVSFAAAEIATNLQQSAITQGNLPVVVAVFLGIIFFWNGQKFSQNIPFATLRLCSASDPSCNL